LTARHKLSDFAYVLRYLLLVFCLVITSIAAARTGSSAECVAFTGVTIVSTAGISARLPKVHHPPDASDGLLYLLRIVRSRPVQAS